MIDIKEALNRCLQQIQESAAAPDMAYMKKSELRRLSLKTDRIREDLKAILDDDKWPDSTTLLVTGCCVKPVEGNND